MLNFKKNYLYEPKTYLIEKNCHFFYDKTKAYEIVLLAYSLRRVITTHSLTHIFLSIKISVLVGFSLHMYPKINNVLVHVKKFILKYFSVHVHLTFKRFQVSLKKTF
jgi:hypothetical protein